MPGVPPLASGESKRVAFDFIDFFSISTYALHMKQALQNNIQAKRKDAGMTQQDLADSVGVTRQTIIAIEKGNYVPSVTLALDLATQFNLPVEQLFFYET